MPQLEQIHTFISQVFWLAITFCILYLVLWRAALPRLAQILQTRQEKIDGDLARAEALKKEAEATIARYEESMVKARGEAQSILRAASDRLAAEATRRQEALTRKLAADTAAAETRIAAARQEAVANLQTVAAEVAQAAVGKLLGETVPANAAAAAVAQAMQERR
jgi:F-type H+-transporting ATPase subunit b